jgi:hypothetical protein
MVKVEFHSGYQIKEGPIAFQFCDLRYKVKEVVDVVVIGFHFKINCALAVPPIYHLFYLVSEITKLEGNRPFFYLIT